MMASYIVLNEQFSISELSTEETNKCQLKNKYPSTTGKQTLWSMFLKISLGALYIDFFWQTIVLIHKMIIAML